MEARVVFWLGIGTTVHLGSDMHTKQQSGFTLVELAVVVFLVGLMASLGLSALNAQMASASISATKKKQETIKDALIFYLGKYKRLPCPSTNINPPNGIESRANSFPANCTGYFGIIPYAELGLSKNAAMDGWENFFSYAVSPQWTSTYDSTATPANGANKTNDAAQSFNVGITGTILVNDRSASTGNPIIPISSSTTGGPAAAFIVSHGKNGLGAFTSKGTQNAPPAGTDELANVPNKTTWALPTSSTFYQREYTDNATAYGTYGSFDDIAQFLNPSDLITPLMKDGSLKSADSVWLEQLNNIQSALVGFMFARNNQATCAPPATQAAFITLLTQNSIPSVDPWGGALTYAPKVCEIQQNGDKIKLPTGSAATPCSSMGVAVIPTNSDVAYTLTTTVNGTINGPTVNKLIAGYQTPLNNCP